MTPLPRHLDLKIGARRCTADGDRSPGPAMYASAAETVALIRAAITETSGASVASVRTLESGVVEEHAVFVRTPERKVLLFRMWPVFYTHDPRVEYALFTADPRSVEVIERHLALLARTRDARLVKKR